MSDLIAFLREDHVTADLIAFLNARLDEEEARARVTAHPARALREAEAKRRLIERYERAAAVPESVSSFVRGQDSGYREACLDAIQDLTAVYSAASLPELPENGRQQVSNESPLRRYDCCEHCDHDINDPPHEIPCPEGCIEDIADGTQPGMIAFLGDGMIAFLGARLDEDEREIRNDPPVGMGLRARLSARMLREVEAKRARLALALSATVKMDKLASDATASDAERAVAVACAAVAIVAVNHDGSVYADHPDYREEWKS